MTLDYQKLAREIIENNQYLDIATVNPDGSPWISTVTYTFDANYNFYFISNPDSAHSQNLITNPRVAFSIYNSTPAWGTGFGLQIKGHAEELSISEIPKFVKLYFGRKWPFQDKLFLTYAKEVRKIVDIQSYKIYKISKNCFQINDWIDGKDVRIEVKL